MRRIATAAALAVLLSGAAALEATAGDGCCRNGRAYLYNPTPYAMPDNPWEAWAKPWDAWRAYYGTQAEVSAARRAGRANFFVATGRAAPSRYFGPPTNYYAERYALEPYMYFTCEMARRGEGICPNQAPLSGTTDSGPAWLAPRRRNGPNVVSPLAGRSATALRQRPGVPSPRYSARPPVAVRPIP